MPERKDCSFCGNPIEPGTGRLFVRRDGNRFNFCTEKCQKNQLKLRRIPRTIKWTQSYVKGHSSTKTSSTERTGLAQKDRTTPAEPPTPKVGKAPKPKAAVASKK